MVAILKMNIVTGRPMNSWIKILSSFLFSYSLYAQCDFAPSVSKVYSFAGPVTVALRDMGLLQNSKVKGISVFNPVDEKDFFGKVYPGGVFLAKGTVSELAGGVIFYDESRELRKVFSGLKNTQSIEVKTRGLIPSEVTEKIIKTISPYLKSCEKELSAWKKKTIDLEEKILKAIPEKLNVLFYMGEFHGARPPQTLIVNDGVVKWLIEKKKIQTYPSPLSYVNWSAKVMNELPKDIMKVGVKDSGNKMIKSVKRVNGAMNLIYPGSLVPGVSQLEAVEFWLERSPH
jgi:hypothetical protein